MTRWRNLTSPAWGRRTIVGLGGLYVALASGWAIQHLALGRPVSNVLLVSLFIGLPGLGLVYGGYRLPRTDIDPTFYPTVAGWCLAGTGLMYVSLVVYQFEPGESISEPIRGLLVLTAFGSVAGYGVGVYDALARTRAVDLERRNRELERTEAELQKTVGRLERANERFEESNERLEQFAYAASHDLREPLRMITNYLTLVEQRYGDSLDEDGREFIGFAVDGADRMRAMIDGLLAYSRVGTQGEPLTPIELDEVLADVRKDLEVRITESGATVESEALPRVQGDRNQLRQLLQNLLSNAIEYSGDGSPRVRISADRTGATWTVSVRDEGIGIDPADTDRIFEIFQRLHTQEEHAGTGIGLALCKRIVERHGGTIRVDSDPSEGTTFSFTLQAAGDRPT
ncbi:sensor histidine kinase [Halorarum halophilum]|uniref:sensor histidine kinase n=1 Tax=Halorarum halophilum TaxID=2743090 RepID=UPI001C4EE25A|nr:ATP-binding protein [Halobaculum halophilum]